MTALAALLSGGLLAWAIPALARTGGSRRPARPTATTSTHRTATTSTHRTATTSTHPRAATSTHPRAATPTPVKTTVGRVITPVHGPGRWSAPFAVSAPAASDLLAPVLAVSPDGAFAVGSGRTDEDAPSDARAAISTGTALDATTPPHLLSGVQQTLAAAYLDGQLVLVTGTSPTGEACCSAASTSHGTSAAQLLAADLEGTTTGALVPVRGGLLAAVDNQAGITVARSNAEGVFAAGESLVGSDPTPPLMAAGALADGGAVVAWTAPATSAQTVTGTTTTPGSTSTTAAGYDQPRNPLIRFALAGARGLPGPARLAVTVPSGREIDALAVVPHRRGATLAWTESWYTGSRYVSEVFWTDVGAGSVLHATELSPPGTAAVGVSLAAAAGGREVLAWQACDVSAGTCRTDAALRPHGDAWGAVRSLGSVDPTSFPVATQSAQGEALVGWIAGGRVRAAAASPAATSFHPSVAVAQADADSNLALGFGSAGQAVAVWVQGTVDQKLVGARFTP